MGSVAHLFCSGMEHLEQGTPKLGNTRHWDRTSLQPWSPYLLKNLDMGPEHKALWTDQSFQVEVWPGGR